MDSSLAVSLLCIMVLVRQYSPATWWRRTLFMQERWFEYSGVLKIEYGQLNRTQRLGTLGSGELPSGRWTMGATALNSW